MARLPCDCGRPRGLSACACVLHAEGPLAATTVRTQGRPFAFWQIPTKAPETGTGVAGKQPHARLAHLGAVSALQLRRRGQQGLGLLAQLSSPGQVTRPGPGPGSSSGHTGQRVSQACAHRTLSSWGRTVFLSVCSERTRPRTEPASGGAGGGPEPLPPVWPLWLLSLSPCHAPGRIKTRRKFVLRRFQPQVNYLAGADVARGSAPEPEPREESLTRLKTARPPSGFS